jgi:hypothetical protein
MASAGTDRLGSAGGDDDRTGSEAAERDWRVEVMDGSITKDEALGGTCKHDARTCIVTLIFFNMK